MIMTAKNNIIEDNGIDGIVNSSFDQTEPDHIALRKAFGSSCVMLVKSNPSDDDIKFLDEINQLAPENKDKIRELVNLYLASQNKGKKE